MFALSPARQTLVLFLLAVAILLPGIWEPTGLTGKDEYFLGLRTPMEMMQGNHWLVPFLDGAPRIRKPPLLYWLGRADFEIFGIGLGTARAVGVFFAALLVISTAGIARRLTGQLSTGMIAGCILIGCLGLATEGRRFMLDVPVAALSTAAFWAFLTWFEFRRFFWLTVSSLLLAAGFLTKGPIVAVVFGSGLLALVFSGRMRLTQLRQHWPALAGNALLLATLALPWFYIVRQLYPDAVNLLLADEIESRQFFNLSPGIALGLLNIAMPWVFVFLFAAWQIRHDRGVARLLILWFLISFLPFMLIKSFDRYLIGSLAPMAILIAIALPAIQARWPFRLGATIAILFGGGLALFAFWFRLGGWYWLVLPAAYLIWAWWQPRALADTLAAPAIFWMALLWGVFPALGVNAVPTAVIELGKHQPVAMFDGPQPAMLPILTGQTHRHFGQLAAEDLAALAGSGTPVFLETKDLPRFQENLAAAGYASVQLGSYESLASHGSGLRFARVGAKSADWKAAFTSRSLAPLMTTVVWHRISKP